MHTCTTRRLPLRRSRVTSPALLEFVEQASDVGRARNKSPGDRERGQWLGLMAAQQPQGIVLLGG